MRICWVSPRFARRAGICRNDVWQADLRKSAAGADIAARMEAVANIYIHDYRTLAAPHRVQSCNAVGEGLDPAAVPLELQQHSLFAPFVELALVRTIVLNREQVENKAIHDTGSRLLPGL